MTQTKSRMLFANLPVVDLDKTKAFFAKLGFTFNPQFTGDKAACMIINEGTTYVMLVTEPFFKTLTTRQIADTKTHLEVLLTLSCESRTEVDKLVKLALEAGGSAAGEPEDHGFMYDWGFYDPDGHGWGVMWMDPEHAQKQAAAC